MGLSDIANSINNTLERSSLEGRRQQVVEHSARNMAHHIVAYVLERAEVGEDPITLGRAMVQGAVFGEDETGADYGVLADPMILFLEGLLQGAKSVISERFGSGAPMPEYDPVDQAAEYMKHHGTPPEWATPKVIARAKAKMAAASLGKAKDTQGKKPGKEGTFL